MDKVLYEMSSRDIERSSESYLMELKTLDQASKIQGRMDQSVLEVTIPTLP